MPAENDARPTWAEIDAAALRSNLAWVRERAAGRRIIGVVKANAYGHGAVPIARELERAGCEALAVATLAEAQELRGAALRSPILLLQGLHAPEQADAVLGLGLDLAVGRLDMLDPLAAAARRAGRRAAIHLKLDSGMTRLGLAADEVAHALESVQKNPDLELVGLMSHLAEADDAGAPSVDIQREHFRALLGRAADLGLNPEWIHLDNSAGLIHGPSPKTNAVRIGLVLYGADPTLEGGHALEPVMSVFSRVTRARKVPSGSRVGYGGTYTTPHDSWILTLPIGYADGLPRAAGGRFSLGLQKRRVPLVGRVSMDLASVDAGPDGRPELGEEILIFGRRKELVIPVEELAAAVDTIAYEIFVGIGSRVPRVWSEG